MIQQDDGVRETKAQVSVIDKLLDALFLEQPVDKGEFFGQVRIENYAPDGGLDELALHLHRLSVRYVLVVISGGEVDDFTCVAQANRGEQLHFARFQREDHILSGAEDTPLALGAGLVLGQVVDAENHVLRRDGQRQTVRGRKNVARAEHQNRRLDLRLR